MRVIGNPAALILLALPLFATTVNAKVVVQVSEQYSAIHYSAAVTLPPGKAELVFLPHTPRGDQFYALLDTEGRSIRVIVLDQRDVVNKTPSPAFLLDHSVAGKRRVNIPGAPSANGMTLGLINEDSRKALLRVTVFRVGRRPPEVVQQMREWIEIPVRALEAASSGI